MAVSSDHEIEYGEELAHAGGQGQFLGFACGAKTLVEGSEDRIEPGGHQGSHVQGSPYLTRPPHTLRFPLMVPLSRLKGATPTRAAISARFKVPSSGRSDKRVMDRTGPTPGVLRSSWSLSLQMGEERMKSPKSRSRSARLSSNHRMCSWTLGRIRRPAVRSRFFSAVIISTSWRRRATSAASSRVPASGRGLGAGRTASEMGQGTGIQGIGLGQFTGGTGEVPHLPGVDHCHMQSRGSQLPRQCHFHSAGGLQHHQPGSQFHHVFHHLADALGIMGDLPRLTGGPHRHIQALRGDIDTDKHEGLPHSAPPRK